ncbi:transcriptional regulator family: Fungal Specific TF [Penicillium samsonianum]|uniref:transcriptional regulator family: Fungal Specific TF n=1 Tax=Penicillium samsonianum TaxID=1882272 RepID=UPI00254809E9|nr:transcriptional regulator family: Fungal Specific TF [Penicillium samsonianum]KAJ6118167.1 transcriptional regulator family: Fungal Specific TF [Penicillium samsonianum]
MADQPGCSPYITVIEDESLHLIPAPTGKKRIPPAVLVDNRRSVLKHPRLNIVGALADRLKVKCDGERPCTRCQKLEKQCVFFEIPKDPVSERIESVESEVQYLRQQLDEMRELLQQSRSQPTPKSQLTHSPSHLRDRQQQVAHESARGSSGSHYPHSQDNPQDGFPNIPVASSVGYTNGHQYQRSMPGSMPALSPNETSAQPLYASNRIITRPPKRKRSGFEIRDEPIADFIDKGLITLECAMSYFHTFFGGCDRYIPIFDPQYDTFDSIRSRSSILLNAICTIGCMVETRSGGGSMSDVLHAELKKWINVIIQNKELNCLESVQAMLVVACYSTERSLILSFATRMAMDLELHEAFDELIQRLALQSEDMAYALPHQMFEEERALMWNARTWFGLLVLEHIFRVDGGKPPGIRLKGNARRCRVLLSHPSSTILDLRLFSQVELNILRGMTHSVNLGATSNLYSIANVGDALGGNTSLDGQSIADYVQDMKIELDLWFDSDWLRIIACVAATDEKPSLLVALRVQKCWAEMMLNCKALRSMGVENVAAMSTTERTILLTAKASARRHLRLIIADPDFYLAKLKYAMDFVWAKCAFSFLLLLKLSRLTPERDEEHQELLEQGNRLLDELSKAGASGTQSGAGNIYLQILKVSIEKYGRALMEAQQPSSGGPAATSPFWELFDAQADLQCFVPEQFVSEWDFPGLNLFYFPTAWQDFFGDFSLAM